MLKINKDYKCPPEEQLDPKWIDEEQLEPKWIDWGNLLVDDNFINGDVTLKFDDDGNIIYNDDIKISTSSLIPTISSMKSMIEDYYNDISQNSITGV